MTINLTETQKQELENAKSLRDNLLQRFNFADAHYNCVMKLVFDAHGLEPKGEIKNGQIVIDELPVK